MLEIKEIDVGDCVRHLPSNEEWVVAAVDGERLYWCGYPFGGSASLSDCILTEKSLPETFSNLLRTLANHNSNERPVLLAKERLEKLKSTLDPTP